DDRLAADVAVILAAHGGVVTSRTLRAHGLSAAQVAALVRSGTLLRLRRDVLVDREVWQRTASWDRHLLRARGVLGSLDPTGDGALALSHHSALALHAVDLYGVDDDVHLVRVG